ncbi:MAG: sigma-70 family RNA polymerase sigma factor [Mariprofundales bacterium]
MRGWLISRMGNTADVDDLLQDVFEKAMLQGERFCSITNARAWLFRVARNMVIDGYRLKRDQVALPDDMPVEQQESEAIDNLSECLLRVLSELSVADREVITRCDLDGMSQQHFADLKGISLPATKSRIQRARLRLRQTLETNCKVRRNDTGNVCCFVPRDPLK